jgi:hypothetical protein
VSICNLDLALAEVNRPGLLTLHHYVVTRADLPRGIQAANLVHAAGESSPGGLPNGTHAVVLVVPDESALRAVSYRLELAGVRFVPIVEDDHPFEGQLMALGIVPAQKEEVRRFVSSLPLLR